MDDLARAGGTPERVNLASIDLNLLVMLDALLEEESVTRAADVVGLSQPAMSHALARLRRLFGDDLLVRSGSGSVPTPRAHELRAPLREALRHTSALFEGSGFDPATADREVTLAMSTTTAIVLSRGLARLTAAEAPGVRLRILTTMELTDSLFTQERVDAVLMSEAFDTIHPREKLYDDAWVLLSGTPDLTEGNALELLRSRPHVAYEALLRGRPYHAMRDAGIDWHVHTRVKDTMLIHQFVAGTARVGVDRLRVVETLPLTDLWWVPFPVPTTPLAIDVVWNPWLGDSPFRRWFASVLRRSAPL